MKHSRSKRRFLIISSAVAIAGATGSLLYSWKTTVETDVIVAILKRRLGLLNVDHQHFYTFSEELLTRRRKYRKKLKYLSVFSGVLSIVTPYELLSMGHPLRRLENYTVSNFLLSTDFFQNGEDQEREIQYFGFYDPYKRPCANFFSD
jgi:hypothetical protein